MDPIAIMIVYEANNKDCFGWRSGFGIAYKLIILMIIIEVTSILCLNESFSYKAPLYNNKIQSLLSHLSGTIEEYCIPLITSKFHCMMIPILIKFHGTNE